MFHLQHHSSHVFSSAMPGKTVVIHQRAKFQLSQALGKPLIFRPLGKYEHPLAVSQHSSPGPLSPVVRRQFTYPPSMWDGNFIESLIESHTESETLNKIRIEELKEKVRNLLIYANGPLQKMNLVDAIDRLGLAYHFDKEIHSSLQQVYDGYDYDDYGDNLYVVALRFLLLRKHGYHMSCDVFEKFQDKEGNFNQSIRSDARGLLYLYEASHCSIHGEDILDNALTFTRNELKSMASHLAPPLATRVQLALELPPQRSLSRLEARRFISFYEDDETRNDILLELAKKDFNQLQSLHRSEIKEVYGWWKELELAKKFPYARDRVVECFVWGMDVNYLPEFSNGRIALIKLINLMTILDDTYDIYGTLDEMELFTEVLERWDIEAMDRLPEYLKLLFLTSYNLVNDTKYLSMKHQDNNAIYYCIKMFQDFCKGYMQEARWFHNGYTPSLDEYLSVSMTTAGGTLITIVAALGMGDMVDKEGLDYIVGCSKILKLINTISRFIDDIGAYKFDQEKGDVAKSIDCYVKEHGVSEQEAYMKIKNLIIEGWKDINQELLNPIPLPKPLVNGILNLGKGTEMFNMNGNDGFNSSQCKFKDAVNSMLFDPVIIG